MIRRNCLKVLGGALAATPFAFNFSWSQERTAQSAKSMNSFGLIKPKVLHEGDAVAVIAPATVVSDPDDIARGTTLDNYSLFFQSNPGSRLLHGKTFIDGGQQPLDTPCGQSNPLVSGNPSASGCKP